MHKALKSEKEELVSSYEKTVDRLKQRLEEKKAITKQNAQNEANSKEVKRLQEELKGWKAKAKKYKYSL